MHDDDDLPQQPGLFDAALEPEGYDIPTNTNGQRTSRTSAIHTVGRVGSLRRRVFETVAAQGEFGVMDWEVARTLGVSENSVRPRMYELRGGYRKWPWRYIRDSGRERTTPSGSKAIVWVALDVPEYIGLPFDKE